MPTSIRRGWALAVAGSLAAALVVAGAGSAGAAPGDTVRVSVGTGGVQGNDASPPAGVGPEAAITPDGRFVAFASDATNLVAGDTNARSDVFVHDRATAVTERVSIGSSGQQGTIDAGYPSISDDGRYVGFLARDLGFSGDEIAAQAYVRDRDTDTTAWVSQEPPGAGILDNPGASHPRISGDGRHLAYTTNSLWSFYGAGSGSFLVVVRDLVSGTYTLASRTSTDGIPVDDAVVTDASISSFAELSFDGRHVSFQSTATNMVPGDANGEVDVFVRDLVAGTTTRVNVTAAGGEGEAGASDARMSADGRRIAFATRDRLTADDVNSGADVYVRDLDAGTTTLASAAPYGTSSTQPVAGSFHLDLSPDGGYVAFWSTANDLVADDDDVNADLFVRDLARQHTQVVSIDGTGAQPGGHTHITVGIAHDPALADQGRAVAFGSRSAGLVPGDTNGTYDVYVHEPVVGAVAGSARFVPLNPTRLLDTRTGEGAPAAKPGPGATIELQVTGRGGVPTDGVAAVVLNVTATEASAAGYVTAFPAGEARPNASNLNLEEAGQTIPNLVVVPVGDGGKVSLFTQSGTHLLADVAGYFAPAASASAGRLVPVTPARVLDTRTGTGAPASRPGPDGVVELVVAGQGGVPAVGASAVVLNVTATEAQGAGYVTVWPTGQDRPNASNLNVVRAGQTIPNLVVVPLGVDGKVSLYTQSGTHLLADVSGWFSDGSAAASASGLFVPVSPARVLDTRDGSGAPAGPLPDDATVDLTLAGRGGLPGGGLGAVVLNVTATEATAAGYVTAWPTGQVRPNASNLNLERAGQTIPNAAIVPVGTGGQVGLYVQSRTHLIADVAGWFVG